MVQLTDREIKIIYLLLNRNEPITVQKLSEIYGVSIRTIKYDLKDLKEWFKDDDGVFQTKPHIGVWLLDNDEIRESVRKRLLGQTGFEYYPAPKKRILQIVFLLSLTDQAVTLQQLENKLNVSESTMLNDLDKIRDSLQSFNINLSHKDFYGYILTGSEYSIRSFMESSIQNVISNFDVYSVIHLLQLNSDEVTGLLLGLNNEFEYIFKRVLIHASKLINSNNPDLDYNDILTISCRLAIVIARLSINKPINSYQEVDLHDIKPDTFDFELFKRMFDEYDFPIYQDEYQYVINGGQSIPKDDNLATLTEKIISAVGVQVDQPFDEDKQLFDSLLSHLMSKLNGKYQFTNEYNPFVKDIKANYPGLFDALYKVCIIEVSTNPAIVNDSFVSFLALHFMVSEQRIHKNQRKVRVVYVCSTGLGVTNLIQQKIEASVPNVEIAGFTSLIAAKKQISKIQPDLVISIFNLDELNAPLIQVSPLPTSHDIEKIKAKVAEILKINPSRMNQQSAQALSINVDSNVSLKDFSRDLIMSMFTVYEDIYGLLKDQISDEYKDAFMLHIFMTIHRIKFNEEYQDETVVSTSDSEIRNKIKEIFNRYQLNINESEISAILEYTRLPNTRGDKIDSK